LGIYGIFSFGDNFRLYVRSCTFRGLMMKFQFVQPIYYHYEIEADSLEDAYAKTGDLGPDDWYDETIGDWEECTPESKS
jgi:hypothetical protein